MRDALANRGGAERSTAYLEARSQAILEIVGEGWKEKEVAHGWGDDGNWLQAEETRPTRRYFWYRRGAGGAFEDRKGGAVVEPGTVAVRLDSRGRLIGLIQAFEEIGPTGDRDDGLRIEPDWSWLLREAAIDPAALADAEPTGEVPVATDRRRAWEGQPADWSRPIRVEAATLAGRFVFFEIRSRSRLPVPPTVR